MREDFETAWPVLAELQDRCRKAELGKLTHRQKVTCDDCREHDGMVFFDAPRGGNRIPGNQVWKQPPGQRFAMPCMVCRQDGVS